MSDLIGPVPAAAATPYVPAGWYPDATTQSQRYWDGTQWTQHFAPLAPAVQPVYQPVLVAPKKQTNHIFHLLMSLITLGLWIPVWIIVAISNA